MHRNLSKQRLREGKAILGVHIPFPAPAVVELAAAAGFHWVLIDCEHGPMNHETVETMIRAAESAGITPVVRPPRNEAATILRYLDMGAQGVFVPNIQSRSDAEAAVRNAKFHPSGQRGLGPYARWARQLPDGARLSDFVRQANDEIMVTLLVESVRGVESLDEILAIDGVDEIGIGLADLSQSLGFPGDPDNAEVQACTNQALSRIVKSGRVAGFGASSSLQARKLLDQGVRSILVGAHTLFLAAGRHFVKGSGVDGCTAPE
jgi:4-hydroxy-2-oxoheptanedioate aldolase